MPGKILDNKSSKNNFFPILLLFIALFIVYGNVIQAGYVYDDRNFIVDNIPVKTWLFENPWDFFLKPEQSVWSGIYRPLRTVSFAIDYQLFGLNPAGYHIENLIIHFINSILVFFLLGNFFKNNKISFLGALLFAVHPVQIESVSWISSRGDLLYAFFTLSCFLWFIKMHKKNCFSILKIILWSCLFMLALLSKEAALGLVPTILTYDFFYCFLSCKTNFKRLFIKRIPFYIVFAGVTLLYLIIRFSMFENMSQKPYWGGSFKANFLTMIEATVYYFRLIFYPIDLTLDYSTYPTIHSFFDKNLLYALFFYIPVIGLFIYQVRRKNYRVCFFALLFVFFLMPSWNILPISAIIAERFLYFSMIGFCSIIVWVFWRLYNKKYVNGKINKSLIFIFYTIYFLLMILTVYRNRDWQNDYSIWKSCVHEFPGNYKGHINLGTQYDARKMPYRALNEYYKLLSIKPYHDVAYYNLGNTYWNLGIFEKAEFNFLHAVKLRADYWQAWNNLGNLYLDKQYYEKAEKCFLKILEGNPSYAKAYFNLGSLYFTHYKNYDKAYFYLKESIKYPEFKRSFSANRMIKEIDNKKRLQITE